MNVPHKSSTNIPAPIKHKELAHHIEAFNLFYNMGTSRMLQSVSDATGYSIQAVQNWKIWFQWDDRIKAKENKMQKRMDFSIKKEKQKHLTYLEEIMDKARDDLQHSKPTISQCPHCKKQITIESTLKCKNMADVEKVIKLQLLIAGDPTEINKITIESVGMVIDYILAVIQRHVTDKKLLKIITEELSSGLKKPGKDLMGDNGEPIDASYEVVG